MSESKGIVEHNYGDFIETNPTTVGGGSSNISKDEKEMM